MGPNENNNFYQKQHLNNNNEQNSSSTTTATSPFTQISTKPIHRIYSTNLIVEEEPTSTTTEELPEEWNNCVNQSLSGLTDLRVHELKKISIFRKLNNI
ncbi:SAP domain-containing protein [Meloidogyne graminicola]|uniref:SAP domain-containing protein n=1 Tax=Meloidogyne graminicola TaxID=189291 RepID=A0A8S9ZQA8_9BILA|nr:SAP domain-containing protein [Meloidogyne graminicola]